MRALKTNLLISACILALIFSNHHSTFADCEDSGPLLDDEFRGREWYISNETDTYISKSLFNIPSLLKKATCFYVLQTEKIETPLTTMAGEYFKTQFSHNLLQHYVLYWVLRDKEYIPLWYRERSFQDHSEKWLDCNGDKNPELILFEGFEAMTKSYLYFNNIHDLSFSEDNFSLIFSQEDEYVIFGELESQVVIFEYDGNTHVNESYYGEYEPVELLKSDYDLHSDKLIFPELIKYYKMSVGIYDSANINVDYGIRPLPILKRLSLLEPTKIHTIRSGKLVDITCELKNHIRWRISLLNRLLPNATPAGAISIKKLISYYKKCL